MKTKTLRSALALGAIAISFFSGCATSKIDLSSASNALKPVALTSSQEKITLLGINDLHGYLMPVELISREKNGIEPVAYTAGGAAVLATHIKLQREKYGSRLLVLDAGDEFQGTIESNSYAGKPVVDFYNSIGVAAAAIGNHEFDFGQGALKQRMSEARYPYLSANVALKKTHAYPDFPNTKPSTLLTAGNVKVGVIGLSTVSTPVTTRAINVANLDFTDSAEAVLREQKNLRAQGADVIVILAHIGTHCRPASGLRSLVHAQTSTEADCDPKEELNVLLKKLPKGSVDAVIAGHTHRILHYWIEGVPVIQDGAYNRYYNMIHLVFDHSTRKVVSQLTRIEGPIPICERVFANQSDCDGEREAPTNGRGPLVKYELYGKTIAADTETEALLSPVRADTDRIKNKVVGEAVRPVEHDRRSESELGNLLADALRYKTGADVAIVNPGGIRTSIDQGPITYEEVFRAFPFDNVVSVLKVTGRELKQIFRVAQSGSRGYFPFSGATVKLVPIEKIAKATDLNHNGKLEPWEVNRIRQIKLDGQKRPIQDSKLYKLATIDFLVTGGDDMKWPMDQVAKDRVQIDSGILVRDAFIEYLAHVGPVNSPSNPLVKKEARRLIFSLK